MSTIYVFQNDTPAAGVVPASADQFLMYQASSGRTKNVTAALMMEAGRTVTAATTSSAMAASGISKASTLLSANTLTDPTQAGQETTILFPSSTAIVTVAPVGATILGSTVTPTGATKITHTPTSDAHSGSVTLIAASTSQWVIKSVCAAVTTLGAPLYVTCT